MPKKKFVLTSSYLIILLIMLSGCQSLLSAGETAFNPTATATWPAEATPTETIVPPTIIPTQTVTPEVIPTETPRSLATPFPTPTLTPVPETGFYSDPALGFSFSYPADWEVDEESPNVIRSTDPNAFVFGQSSLIDPNETVEDYVSLYYGWVGEPDEVEATEPEAVTLWDGTEAQVIEFAGPDDFFKARATVATRGQRVFMVLIAAAEETFTNYPETLEAIAASMQLEDPRPFGISRENAIFLAGGEPRTLDPIQTHGSAGGRIGQIFSGLVMLGEDMTVIPDLAESWEISPDGTTYTFHLHRDATFHDGKPVTAHDIKYSWERAADSENESDTVETYLGDIVGFKAKFRGEADEVSGVTVIDDHTVQVEIDAPKSYFLAKLTYPTSFIVDEANVQNEDWERQPNGTGPFRLVRWEEDEVFILERNENFYLPPPFVENIVYLMYPDVSMWMYENDEVDLTGIGVNNLERVTDPTNPLSRDLYVTPSLCTSRLVFGVALPPFDDPLVRQAFSYAIDRQIISDVMFKGISTPANSILPPGMPGHDPTITSPQFDPEKARTLLQQSSYGGPENLPEITFTLGGQGSNVGGSSAAYIDMWRTHLGVEVQAEYIDPDTYFDEIDEQPRQLISSGWCADYPDPENFLDILYHSESNQNRGLYHNPEIDELLEIARVEPDLEKRFEMYNQIERMIIADSPDILLNHSQSYFLLKPYLQNYLLTPTSLALNWRVVSINHTAE